MELLMVSWEDKDILTVGILEAFQEEVTPE